MRVAHITADASSQAGEMASALCRMTAYAGHKALLCHVNGTAASDLFSCRVGSRPDAVRRNMPRRLADAVYRRASLTRHLLLSRVTDRAGFYSKGLTRKLIAQLEAYQPDLVHLHDLHGYCFHLPTLLGWLKEKDIPVVWTLRDCWAYTGHCLYYADAKNAPPAEGAVRKRIKAGRLGCDRWTAGCGNCVLKGEYPRSLLKDQSARNWREKRSLITSLRHLVLTVPSRWLLEETRRSFLSSFPVYRVPDALPPGEYGPCADPGYLRDVMEYYRLSRVEGRKMLLSAADVWDERSGLEDLILLAEALGEEYCVTVVGLDEYQLSSLPKKHMLGLGPIANRKDLCALLSAADLYVSAVHADASCVMPLKALACGTQVLCYDTSAFPEVVTEEVGRAVPLGDIEAMARAAAELCAEPKDAAACMARAGEYTAATREAAYMRLYENMYRHSPGYEEALRRAEEKQADASGEEDE